MRCPLCGRENPDNLMICQNCGSRMGAMQPLPQQKKKKRPFFKRTGVRVTAIVLAVSIVAASVFGVLYFTGALPFGGKSSPDNAIGGRLEFKQFSDEDVAFDGGVHYVKEQLAITADEKYSYSDVEKFVKQNGGEIVGCIEFTNDYQIEFAGADYNTLLSKKEQVASALENSDVQLHEAFEFNYEDVTTADAKGGNWWREAIRLDKVEEEDKEENRTYENVKVGIIDSCFWTDNSDLSYAFEGGEAYFNEPYRKDKDEDEEKEEAKYQTHLYHGTQVAGFIAAKKSNRDGIDGVANNVTLFGISSSASHYNYFVSALFYKYALAKLFSKDCKVINLSGGNDRLLVGAQNEIGNYPERLERYSNSLKMFLEKYIEAKREFVIVKCAGNNNGYTWYESEEEDGSPSVTNDIDEATGTKTYDLKYSAEYDLFGHISSPEVSDRIIIVGSMNQDLNVSDHSVYGNRVDIYAPGYGLKDVFGEKDRVGTSYATPIVAGVVALMWGRNPTIKADHIKSHLVSHSKNTSLKNFLSGYVVDAYGCVHYANSSAKNEVSTTEQKNMVMGAIRKQVGADLEEVTKPVVVDIYRPGEDTPFYSKITDEEGGFTIAHLEPGNYEISSETMDGFWYSERVAFEVKENDATYIDYCMLEPPTLEIVAGKSVKQVRDYFGNEFDADFGDTIYHYTDGNFAFYNNTLLPGFVFFIEKANSDYYNLATTAGNMYSEASVQRIKQKIQNGDYDGEQLRIAAKGSAQFIRGLPVGQNYSKLAERLTLQDAIVSAGLPRITQTIKDPPQSMQDAGIIYEDNKDYYTKSGKTLDASEMSSLDPKCEEILVKQSMSFLKNNTPRSYDGIDREDEILR